MASSTTSSSASGSGGHRWVGGENRIDAVVARVKTGPGIVQHRVDDLGVVVGAPARDRDRALDAGCAVDDLTSICQM